MIFAPTPVAANPFDPCIAFRASRAAVLILLLSMTLAACRNAPAVASATTPSAPLAAYPTVLITIAAPAVTPTPTLTLTPRITPSPTITATPTPPDYTPMLDSVQQYIDEQTAINPNLAIGFAFVDVQTGQAAHINGDVPHYSLSTFKGPLAAYYLWLVESSQLIPESRDAEHIVPMLRDSSNIDTSCMIKRVGGIAPFNDWLAEQGFPRATNFVFRFQSWACKDDGAFYLPDDDTRYSHGDAALGLPGNFALMQCVPGLTCDKMFVPLDLAYFYARVYRGEVLNAESTAQWLTWMNKPRDISALYEGLPEHADVQVYAKNGYRASDAFYDKNFFNEAGIVVTPRGAYVIAVFMRGNPRFPGGETIGAISRIVYDYFIATH